MLLCHQPNCDLALDLDLHIKHRGHQTTTDEQQEAHQLVGPVETPRHSTRKSLQTFGALLVVNLHQIVAELFHSFAGFTGFAHLYAVFSYILQPPEASIDVY